MRLGFGQLLVIFLLVFLLFGNFTKVKLFIKNIIVKIKENFFS
jgi:Sec-independent protein translocase protein TatA